MSEGVVREVLSGRGGGGGMMGTGIGVTGGGGGGWGGGWGGGDSREWLAIAATAPLPLLGLSWALLVSRLHRRLWRPVDVFVAALLSAGIAKQALTLAFALLSLLLLPPDGGRGMDPMDKEERTSPSSGMAEGGWSWDGTGGGGGANSGSREEALCSAAVWGLTSAHALQAAALASLAADRALLALGSRPRRFRAAQARYHVCVLAVVSALVGAAGVFARGGTVSPMTVLDDDPCLFLPHQLDARFALFWICLHGGLLLSGATLAVMVTARLCCCFPVSRSWRHGAEEESGCCEDEEETALPVPSPCDTSTAASTASTTASGRCGSTAALYAASAPSSGVGSKCGCAGGGTDVAMAFRWTEAPARAVDLRAELRWPTVMSLMALYYLLNHLPVLGVTVLGTFAPSLLPRRWPLGTVVLWAGLAQDALLPLVLTVADSRFAGWAKRVYSGAASPASSPSANELRRQHQQQQQLRQQQLEQRRQQQQQHLLHQQLQQQLQERRRRLEMTLDSPLPTRAEHEPAYAITAVPTKGEKDERSFHLAPPWKQKNSISVESLFQSKSDISQQMSPPYMHHTLTTPVPPGSGSNPNCSTGGSSGREGMKFPLTNGSLFTVGADGRYPVMRNYRRGTSSNSAGHPGRLVPQMVTNPRCDAMLPLSSIRHVSTNQMADDDSANEFGCTLQPPPPPRTRAPLMPSSMDITTRTIVNRSEESDSELEEEPIYATLSSLEEDCEDEPEDDEDDDVEDGDDEEDEDDDDDRPASPMSSCSVTTAANDDFEYRDAKGAVITQIPISQSREEISQRDDDAEIEEVIFRLPERNIPSALGLYRLRLDELAESTNEEGTTGEPSSPTPEGSGLIRSPHNFHRRRYRRVPPNSHASRRLGGVAGIVLSVDSLQTALSRPDAVAYLDNGERMSGSVPDFKKVFVSEFI